MIGAARRLFSSTPLLEEQLRKMYLRIHPDLLSRFPNLQKVNSDSFAELNAIVSAIKNGNSFQKNTVMLRFYVRKDKIDDDGDANEENEHELIQVGVDLPKGDWTSSQGRNEIERALKRIFKSYGIPEQFEWGNIAQRESQSSWTDFDGEPKSYSKKRRDVRSQKESYSAFLLRKESKGMQNERTLEWFVKFIRESSAKSLNLRTDNAELNIRSRSMIADLRISGFRIIIDDEHEMPISEQFELVAKFFNAFKNHQLAEIFKKSSIFVISKNLDTSVDQIGRICLNSDDNPSEWLDFVSKLGISARFAEPLESRSNEGVTHRQEFKKLKDLERFVTNSIGVYDVFAEYAVLQQHGSDYNEFLSKLVSCKVNFQTLGKTFQNLDEITIVASKVSSIEANTDLGAVLVPLSFEPYELIEFIELNGSKLLNAHEAFQSVEESRNQIIVEAKRRLRIPALLKDGHVSEHEYMHCVHGLRALPRQISQLFGGLIVIISDRFEFLDRGLAGTIRIHWDSLKEW